MTNLRKAYPEVWALKTNDKQSPTFGTMIVCALKTNDKQSPTFGNMI